MFIFRLRIILGALAVAAGIIAAAFRFAPQGQALTGTFFGGRIVAVTYCCNGIFLTIGPPAPGIFMVTATSLIYPYHNIYAPGANAIGTALPIPGTCQNPKFFCAPLPPLTAIGRITKIGTSGL